jgi:hypothetical protein
MLPVDSRSIQSSIEAGMNKINDRCNPSADCKQGINGIFKQLSECSIETIETVANISKTNAVQCFQKLINCYSKPMSRAACSAVTLVLAAFT